MANATIAGVGIVVLDDDSAATIMRAAADHAGWVISEGANDRHPIGERTGEALNLVQVIEYLGIPSHASDDEGPAFPVSFIETVVALLGEWADSARTKAAQHVAGEVRFDEDDPRAVEAAAWWADEAARADAARDAIERASASTDPTAA